MSASALAMRLICGKAKVNMNDLRKGFVVISDVHEHKTRASCTVFHISGDDVVGSFSYFGKKEWNALPDRLKTIENIDLFKIKLKQHLMEEY